MASSVIEKTIYNGKYTIRHDPNARGSAPRYVVTDGEYQTKPKGVTSILGQTIAKDLMAWAVGACCDYLRTKLPNVTEEDLVVAADEYNRLRDKGGGTGTEAHAMVENYLKGEIGSYVRSKEATNAFKAFVKWFEEVKPTVINVEEVIFSQMFRYAGTYDCMLEIEGKVYLCDLKTTNASRKAPVGVYAEHFIQLGAYAWAHEEQRLYEEQNGGTDLRKIDELMVISAKKDGILDVITTEDLDLTVQECGYMFGRVVNLNRFLEYVTKELGGK